VTSVNTPAPPPPTTDTVAPTVSIASPSDGMKISGRARSVLVSASAADNVGVTKMEVYIDGALRSTSGTGSISYTWDVSRLSKGQHTVLVKAYDAAGNVGQNSVVVKK
jgi:hypothetical protein